MGGRFGRVRLVDHLLGKTKTPSAFEAGLSTFGVGQELSTAGWRDLFDQLLFDGLLREDPNDGRPLIGLGDADGVKAILPNSTGFSASTGPAGCTLAVAFGSGLGRMAL